MTPGTFSTLKDKEVTVVTFGETQTAGPSTPPGPHTSGPASAAGAHTAGPAVASGAHPAAEPDTIMQLFWAWINQPTVPSRKAQFSRELQEIHSQVWQAATTSWGTPVITSPPPKSAPVAAESGAAANTSKGPNAKASVDMKTAPGTQPVPGGLSGSLAKVGLNAIMNVKQ